MAVGKHFSGRRLMSQSGLKSGNNPSGASKKPANQREHSRIGYKQVQRIAPLANGELPRYDQFIPVKCNDVSRGGVSFFADDEPTYSDVVVEIVARDVTKYLFA